eukprot:CAMPEP_0202961094 /NCGR_PEP_ID=MMETSP1396-20130829/5178_1 /ASSEMBLY_ACC=CAM_ASM_000872 /TAXON_ID= /ORGANISM="Pseudokeronopsis sp., Strain Brazil" /LENGTH=61 /DNA_ID=CAMNT_0049680695 /DNA_START=324 /DNA_END=509 /DNA_ORIENTATION=+
MLLRRLELYVVEDAGELVFFEEFVFEDAEHGEAEAVEEDPPAAEELVEELAHQVQGNYIGE